MFQQRADPDQHACVLAAVFGQVTRFALPSDDGPKTWPPHITVAGTSVYLIAVRALPVTTASKLGKPAPFTISYDELVDPGL